MTLGSRAATADMEISPEAKKDEQEKKTRAATLICDVIKPVDDITDYNLVSF